MEEAECFRNQYILGKKIKIKNKKMKRNNTKEYQGKLLSSYSTIEELKLTDIM